MTQVFECTIVVVDVVGFTAPERHLSDRLAVHQGMYEVLKTAFVECDIDFDSCAKEDRGDGVSVLLPSGMTRSTVADRLPERIVVALRRYNWTWSRRAQIRLRVSLNSGDVVYDGHGWVGEAVDDDPGRCTLAFWRRDDPEVWPPALGGIREIAIDEAEYRVDEVIVAAERVWSGQACRRPSNSSCRAP